MNLYGSLKQLVQLVFSQNSQSVVVEPNQGTTYTATRTYQLPPGDASDVLVGAAATQTLTSKTLDGGSNTLTNLPAANLAGQVSVANGGTGLASLTAGSVLVGAGTSSPTLVAPGTAGNVLTSSGGTWVSSPATGGGGLTNTYISSATTAVAGKNYLANTTGGAYTVTLPAGSTGASVRVADDAGTFATNNLTVAPSSGQVLNGYAANDTLVMNLSNSWAQFDWDSTNSKWVITTGGFQYGPLYTPGTAGIVPGTGLPGVTTVGTATAGTIGEFIEAKLVNTTWGGGASAFGNIVTITLSAGEWDVNGMATWYIGSAVYPSISTLEFVTAIVPSGFNSDYVTGQNANDITGVIPVAFGRHTMPVPPVRVQSDGTNITINGFTRATQILALAGYPGNYTSGAPTVAGRISARRVR